LSNQLIAVGDNILLYLDVRRTYMIKVQAGQSFHTHKGYIKFDDIIGKSYGSTFKSSLGINFTVLKPQLMDYILKSQRNTQIIYAKDAALIVMFSGIGPGSRVVESGTGTGPCRFGLGAPQCPGNARVGSLAALCLVTFPNKFGPRTVTLSLWPWCTIMSR